MYLQINRLCVGHSYWLQTVVVVGVATVNGVCQLFSVDFKEQRARSSIEGQFAEGYYSNMQILSTTTFILVICLFFTLRLIQI